MQPGQEQVGVQMSHWVGLCEHGCVCALLPGQKGWLHVETPGSPVKSFPAPGTWRYSEGEGHGYGPEV